MMQYKISSEKPKDNVALQALSMAFGTMSSRVLGLVRDMAFSAMFSRTVTDAWSVAFRLPNMLRRLLGEGAMSVSFIPIFIEAKEADPSGVRARNLVNSFYTVLLIFLGTLTAIGIIHADTLVDWITEEGYAFIPNKFELTVRMARIMFGFIFFMSSYAFFMGILNAFGRFGLPGIAPTLFNVAMIISNFVPKEYQPVEGDALAWGVLIGGLLQAGILVPALIKLGYLPKLTRAFENSDATRVWKNMVPGLLGMGLLQVTTFINTRFASGIGEGTNTYLYLADRLLELPLSLVSVSLGTALLPTLSRYWERHDRSAALSTANYYFRLNLYTAWPAALGLALLAQPIVELLFMRGKFSPADVEITSGIVRIYAATLLVSSSVRVLVPSFYAVKNTRVPALISVISLTAHLILAIPMKNRWGVNGLVGSTLISSALNLLLLFLSHNWLIGRFGITRVVKSFGQFVVPGLCLALVTQTYFFLFPILGGNGFARLFGLLVTIVASAAVYGAISYWMGLEEFKATAGRIFERLARKLKKT